jgi:predicted AAA+ superfamily ATPase
MYERNVNDILRQRLAEPRRFIQVLLGPRQTGKTTSVHQVLSTLPTPSHYANADAPTVRSSAWLSDQWAEARRLSLEAAGPAVLAIDEVQKVPQWSSWVKQFWDEDTWHRTDVRVVLLGSSPLRMQHSLAESLAGRYEPIRVSHWSWPEGRDAFGWSLDEYVYFGGYPGTAPLIGDETRWKEYVAEFAVESTVSRDILLMTRVDKPALLRRLLYLTAEYAGRELTYTKMLGRLDDAGNTTTIAHYLDLLDATGLAVGLQKYSGHAVRRRRSVPKLAVYNTALLGVADTRAFRSVRDSHEEWGRRVEACVGAHLLNRARVERHAVHYWRAEDREVDFVYAAGDRLIGIGVKSGASVGSTAGMVAFKEAYPDAETMIVGTGGMPLEEFLSGGAGI